MKMKLIWLLALFLLVDSVLRILRSSFNLGSFLMYVITALVWAYALFHRSIDAFCAAGAGRVLKILFFCGCAVFVGLMVLIGVLGHMEPPTGEEKAVIVLGAGLRGERVTGLLARRLDATLAYHAKNPDALIVVTGGQGPGESIPEAQAMKKYLVERGVQDPLVFVEPKSTSTEENFAFAGEILAREGISEGDAVAYVTNTFHCYRAGKYAQSAGFSNANAVPATIGADSVLPCYMREVFAVMYYWVFRA